LSHFFQTGETEGYIMVVEDSTIEATMVKSLLASHGFTVKTFLEGVSAYEFAVQNPPILVVSDVLMPGIDGFEFCEKFKSTPNLQEVPVILLTALQDPLDIIHGLKAGANNFITKPFEPKYLLSRVNYLLANRELRSSGGSDMVLEIMFNGSKYAINSERKQILDLLLSVYETSIEQNKALVAAQRQLQEANEQLGLANRDLEAFSYTISHDLRTPLNHIGVSAQLIKERHEQSFDAEDKSYLETILGTVRSMSEMIQDLLQFSRSGNIAANLKPLDLTEMTQQIAEWIRQEDPMRHVDFVIEKDMQVMADSSLLMVVMKNLLGNAWKYTSRKSHAEIAVGVTRENGCKTIFVKDNGAGFDCMKAWNLFTPFVRLHSQDDFPGTGVGLATVRRIIERHGGKIWANGKTDEGATFYFTLPEQNQ
jgi:two-component system, sensor histidine kinase and response regulator